MLSEAAKKYLSSLVYSKYAERKCSMIPLSGIYWSDEIPDFHILKQMSDEARGDIYRLFRIRYNLWDSVELSPEDLEFLEVARLIAPDCPIFKRLVPSDDELLTQKEIREEMSSIYAMMADRSEDAEIKENKDGTITTSWRIRKR
jgi:hypothetical protein